jgi:hypothetical protein
MVCIGACVFAYDIARRWCRTTFRDGAFTEVYSDPEPVESEIQKFSRWGYPATPEGVAVGRIEHEHLHASLPVVLFGLDCSPEFDAQAHGFITSYRSVIPPELRPWPWYSIPFEESLVVSTTVYIRSGRRDSGWRTKAFPEGTNALDWIAARTDLEAFAAEMRAALDALWE